MEKKEVKGKEYGEREVRWRYMEDLLGKKQRLGPVSMQMTRGIEQCSLINTYSHLLAK